MGLDSVEIVMDVERTFDIKITDQEAGQIRTVGDFHDVVWKHLEGKYSDQCNTQIVFYLLRRSFCSITGIPLSAFIPDASLNDLLHTENRKTTYAKIEKESGLVFPSLVLPRNLAQWLIGIGIFSILGGFIFSITMIKFYQYSNMYLLVPAGGVVLTALLNGMLKPLRTIVPHNRIDDFVHDVMVLNYNSIISRQGTGRREMEMVLNSVVADKTGHFLHEITPDKSFTDDLGID